MPSFGRRSAAVAAVAATVGLAGCGANTAETAPPDPAVSGAGAGAGAEHCRALDPQQPWYGDNRAALDRMLQEYGTCAGDTAGAAPVALFDWDNTVVKNDIGSATASWMIRNDKILQPDDWAGTSRYLTPGARAALADACGTAVPAGRPLPTSTDVRCADEIRSVLDEKQTTGGEDAFAGYDHRRIEPAYAWAVALMAGHTEAEIEQFAAAARSENLQASEGAQQQVGSASVDGWVRYYEPVVDLVGALRDNGFDVRIISASAEPVVRVWAEELGLTPDEVIGVRPVVDDGRVTARLAGCGDVADGEDAVMPYVDGKRCWVNQVVFGVEGAAAFAPLAADRRQVFAAGDSVTDVTFLGDATGLRLVINRNNPELMCRAYDNEDGRWLVNPMFLEPKDGAPAPYPCASSAFVDAAGQPGPVVRTDGSIVADQVDSVHGA